MVSPARTRHVRWIFVPVRALGITVLLTLMSFAISLLLGITGVLIRAGLMGIHPNLTIAYRHIALPVAVVVAPLVLISTITLEIRRYRQTKALISIENAG
jgi:hypothetical protein